MWAPDELGGVISLYSYLPLMSMTIGPITGAIITQYSTWRWAFYSLAIAAALASFVGIFLLRETYAPRLLRLKANKLRKSHSDPRYHVGDASLPTSLSKTLLYGFVRPLKMAFTQPVIVALALYLAYIWGLLYFLLSTFGTLWQEKYHESIVISSLNYLSLAIGLYLGTQIGASLSDKVSLHSIDTHCTNHKTRSTGT
jgi:MFS family permease